ncbi:MAG: tripartite tricarboxylate transporter TctB family protein [Desulfopila sp.]
MNTKMRDLLGSAFMLVFVVSLFAQRDFTTPFGGIFPDIWMGILVALVAITILLTWSPWSALQADDEKKETATRGHWFDMVVVGAILLGWAFLLRYLGFLATGILGFGSISWFLNDRRNSVRGFLESMLIGVAMVAVLILVFQYGLKVPLPKGNVFN